MNGVREFFFGGSVGNIRWYDEHSDTALRQSGLTCSNRLSSCLIRGHDHVAKNAAPLEYVIVVNLLN